MRSRRRWIAPLLGLAGCARLVGLDELRDEERGPEQPTFDGSRDAGPTAPVGTGVGAEATAAPEAGSAGGGAPIAAGEGGSEGLPRGVVGASGAAGSGGAPGAPGSNAAGLGGSTGSGGAPGVAGAAGTAGAPGVAGSTGMGGSTGVEGSAGSGGAAGVVFSSCPANLLVNGGFEAGPEPWVSFTTGTDPLIYDSTESIYEGVIPHSGIWLGWLGGVPIETNRLSQTVTVPAEATELALTGALRVQLLAEHVSIDYLRIQLVVGTQATGTQAIPLAQFTNADAGSDWVDLAPPPVALPPSSEPLSVRLEIESETGSALGTYFYVDDLALVPTCPQ